VEIYGYDKDVTALDISSKNAINAGVGNFINFDYKDFFTSEDNQSGLFLIMNPPYGERLESNEDMLAFYKQLGDTFKNHYKGSSAWVLSANIEALKNLGLRSSKKIKLFNGPLECRLECFEMYEGSKKKKN
ncbi:MAG: RNA methyltransferase, partial [Bacteroidales bacterium]|nr:RNA methyltransferase [Bacteroidales bacterium]